MDTKKNYQIRVNGKLIDVTQEVYVTYYSMERRARFLMEKDEKHGLLHYSDLDTEEILGEEMIPDLANPSVEMACTSRLLREKLHKGLEQLPAEDRVLLQAIYFDGMSSHQLSAKMGIPQTTVSYRCRRAISRLRKYFEK